MMYKAGIMIHCILWVMFLSLVSYIRKDQQFQIYRANKAQELEQLLDNTFGDI